MSVSVEKLLKRMNLSKELQDILTIQLQENVKGRILDNEQVNTYVLPAQKAKKLRSQTETYTYLSNKKYL